MAQCFDPKRKPMQESNFSFIKMPTFITCEMETTTHVKYENHHKKLGFKNQLCFFIIIQKLLQTIEDQKLQVSPFLSSLSLTKSWYVRWDKMGPRINRKQGRTVSLNSFKIFEVNHSDLLNLLYLRKIKCSSGNLVRSREKVEHSGWKP